MMKIIAVINKSKIDNKDQAPLKIRITSKGLRKEVYLAGVKVEPKNWDSKKQKIKNNEMLTVRLRNEMAKYQKVIDQNLALEKTLTPAELIAIVNKPKDYPNSFKIKLIDFIEDHFSKNATYAYGTKKSYKSLKNHINSYDADITLDNLTVNWVNNFKDHLLKNKKINLNTLSALQRKIRRIAHYAHEKSIIPNYPLQSLKINSVKAYREFLPIDQLKTLENFTPPLNLANTYKAFMFACYTGLRFSDLATITQNQIIKKNDSGSKDYSLYFTMRKTKKQIEVALSEKALNYISILSKDDELIFSFLSKDDLTKNTDHISMKIESANALANKRLKEILKLAGLDPKYSFHCARHTFACIALQLGVDLMSLRDLIGHTDLKVTQEYLKVIDSQKRAAVNKFNLI
ncbi:MAG: site-specific integrase [Saprospiraceae bacterium]